MYPADPGKLNMSCGILGCRLPGHLYDLRYKIRNAADKLASLLQRTPTDAEVAEHLNMPIKKVLNIKSVRAVLCRNTSLTCRRRSSNGVWTPAVCYPQELSACWV